MTRLILASCILALSLAPASEAGWKARARRSAACSGYGSACGTTTVTTAYACPVAYTPAVVVLPTPQAAAAVEVAPGVTPVPAPSPGVTPVPAPSPVVVAGDPYGFGSWLNGVRASRGLAALAYDPGLASIAAANSTRGFGHHRLHHGRENVGMGALATVESMWLADPPHASALLDPGLRSYGIATVNGVWTYVAR